MARKVFTMESNADKIVEKIKEKPHKVMGTIAGNLVREIRNTTLKSQYHQRYKILSRGTRTSGLQWAYGYDHFNKKKDTASVQIGFKHSIPALIKEMLNGNDPIKPVVIRNAKMIQELIATALQEIRNE